MENSNLSNEFLTSNEVCDFLKISKVTLWRLTKNTDFPKGIPFHGNRLKRYSVIDIKAWLKNRANSVIEG
ncbi:helix-turn-helix domain-containing protein [Succinivibrio sp.]|jgi:predicted DNA-binding transcriptional regulator AlpA|uniref:helix-turn-helix transcriptional regulator n=1 Tax=Succinivibrio sp. TaxID=2053619 RepID=UPI0025DCA6D9|nr:helix-turn-helix domain-containing protein [Succinivibrio sp.]MBQ9221694.1 helix-turn-helix domain-containing protein [Succinivibrio sp.]